MAIAWATLAGPPGGCSRNGPPGDPTMEAGGCVMGLEQKAGVVLGLGLVVMLAVINAGTAVKKSAPADAPPASSSPRLNLAAADAR
ncbi:MAG: hypothetical protein K1X57_13170 [Gemmataceae bacterium]|nr:hypothetical protein [Gemmataceae bacterium]